ncbi:MAG TPA: glucose-1-phosphate adenylyltransferase, partial [Acholeplasma sp.]|nr:glucose-1-phosphate adenylyltransferase [Acholeplasma sp.]
DIGILTQYLPFSLNEHIGVGKPWDLDRKYTGVTLLHPHNYWYAGTADAVLKNIAFVKRRKAKYVLILSGDHIYKMDYRKMLEVHKNNNAELTIATIPVEPHETERFGMLETNDRDKIVAFEEKPKQTKSTLASMGIYIFNVDTLVKALDTVKEVDLDFGKHIIPHLIDEGTPIYAYRFNGYWRDVGTYDSYIETNLELTVDNPPLNLYDEEWKIYTRSEEKPPVKVSENAIIQNSLISNGCVIKGKVINSVLSPGVYVGEGTVIENSIILNDSVIGNNSYINHVILDKQVEIGNNVKLGYGDDNTANIERPDLLSSGITVLEKRTIIPNDVIVGKNVRIYREGKINDMVIKSGTTIK